MVCCVYLLELPHQGNSNDSHNFMMKKKKKNPTFFYFVAIRRTSQGLKNELELAMVNEPSVFELLRFDCI